MRLSLDSESKCSSALVYPSQVARSHGCWFLLEPSRSRWDAIDIKTEVDPTGTPIQSLSIAPCNRRFRTDCRLSGSYNPRGGKFRVARHPGKIAQRSEDPV